MTEGNVLYYGDNLDVLRRHVRDESVDLVYLDPPFNSNANYNLLFEEHGEKAAAQVQAFTDSWEWNTDARLAYEEVVEQGGRVADTMRAFRTMIPGSDMLAYLAMMAPPANPTPGRPEAHRNPVPSLRHHRVALPEVALGRGLRSPQLP